LSRTAVLVCPNDSLREAITAALARLAIDVVGEAASPALAVDICASRCPDLVVLGMRLVDAGEILQCRRIRAVSPSSRLLALTWYAGDRDSLAALLAGASACLLLQARSIQELTQVVTRVLDGANLIYEERGDRFSQLAQGTDGRFTDLGRAVLQEVFQLKSDSEIASGLSLGLDEVQETLAKVVHELVPPTRSY
jgi:DNA-binding NarL/FixJ family response regulator